MSLPHHHNHHLHHHHQHMPGLLTGKGAGGGPLNHHPSGTVVAAPVVGHPSLMAAHLFDHIQPPPTTSASLQGAASVLSLLPQPPPPLGTMDSQCPGTPVIDSPTVVSKVPLLHTAEISNSSSNDQFPNSDLLLSLIARNKALEGEWIKSAARS